MRIVLSYLLISLAACIPASAQFQLRYIDTLFVVPAHPCPGDTVSVVAHFVCNTSGTWDIGTTLSQNGNFFEANEVLCQGMLQAFSYPKDTFDLGVLAQGTHVFKCNYWTADASFNCQGPTLWDSSAIGFIVGPPNAQIFNPGPTVTICQGGSATLQTNIGPSLSYQWLLNGNPIPGANASSYTASQAGAYQAIVTGCNYPDTSNTVTVVVSVPQVSVSIPGHACDNDPGYLLSGGSPPGGSWSGPYVSGSNFDCFTAPIGAYPIIYTYTDAFNCTGQATDTLQVLPSPAVSLSQFLPICELDSPFPLSGGQPTGGSYAGPGVSNGTFDPAAAGPGIHLLNYTYFDANLCSGSATQPITVNPAPSTPVITQVGDTLFSSATSGNQWHNLAGPIPGANGSYYVPTASGTYYVTTTDGFGCGSLPSNQVVVVVTGLEENLSGQWQVAWVKDQQVIRLRGLPAEDLEISLNDLQGRVLLQQRIFPDGDGKHDIYTSGLSDGMYLLQVRSAWGLQVRRVVTW